MNKKRILSLLLAASFVASSLSFTVFADSAATGETAFVNEWVATSGPKELNVTHIDESADANGPDADAFYRLYDYKNAIGVDAALFDVPSNPFTVGKTYRMYAYMRSLVHVNEATYGDESASSDADNNMTIRICYNNAEKALVHITDGWALYSADFTAISGVTTFEFRRHWLGSEDTVPFDIGGIYFVELDAAGNEIGQPITPDGSYSPVTGSSIIAVNMKDEVFDRIEIPTDTVDAAVTAGSGQQTQKNTVPATDGFGFTVVLTGSDDVILKPGKYSFTGDFRLGWFDHAKLTLKSGGSYLIASDSNTAPLQAYIGSTLLGSASLNPVSWTTVSKAFELTEDTPMSKIKIELGAIASLDFRNITVTPIEFTSDDGDIIKVTPLEESYISVRNRDYYDDRIIYKDTTANPDGSAKYVSGTSYTISFKARTLPYIAATDGASNNPAKFRVFAGGAQVLWLHELTADWSVVTFEATNFTGEFYLAGSSYGYGVAPFDIKDLTIVKTGTTANLAANANGVFENGAGWDVNNAVIAINKPLSISIADNSEFFRLEKPASGISAFNYASDEELAPGIYYVSGDFRLGEKIDYGKYEFTSVPLGLAADKNGAKLSVNIAGEALKTLDGKADIIVTPEDFVSATFLLKLTSAAKKSDIEFTLDGAYALDFKNVTVENKASEFDSEFTPGDGSLVSRVEADTEAYIHVTGRDYFGDAAAYSDTTKTYDPTKTYEISFMARTDKYIAGADPIGTNPAKMRAILTGALWQFADFTLTPDFVQYGPFEVTGFNGSFSIYGSSSGYGVVPFDIKNLVITEKGATENLAVNADSVFENGAGWEIGASGGPGVKDFAVSSVTDGEYLVIPASSTAGEPTSVTFTNSEKLAPGIYHISGSFKLAEPTDFNKYTFASAIELASDGNAETLTVNVNGENLKTLDGEESVTFNIENWTTSTFKLIVKEGDTVLASDIKFVFGSAVNVGVKDIEIVDGSKLYNPNYLDANGEFAAIIDESDEDPYISFDGRDAGDDRIVYKAGNVEAGAYTISFKARTKPFIAGDSATVAINPARIRAYSGSEMILWYYELTPEWTTVTMSANNFTGEFHICGSSYGYGFAPFDIKDLSIVKDGTIENIAANTLLPETNGIGWSTLDQGGSLKSLTVTPNSGLVYNRILASDNTNTEINFTDSGLLEAGVYHITGKFRVNNSTVLDYNKYESDVFILTADGNVINTNLRASLNGVNLITLSGNDSANVSDAWTEVTFVLDSAVEICMNGLSFELDGAYTLDFADINVTLIEKKATLKSSDISTVMTLLMLKKKHLDELGFNAPWVADGSSVITVVDTVLDNKTGLSGKEDGPVSNSHIHFGGRDNHFDRLTYANDNAKLMPGTYKLSFWGRAADIINTNAVGGSGINLIRVMLGSGISLGSLSSEKSGAFKYDSLVLSKGWSEYTFIFTLETEQPFKFGFTGSSAGYGVIPFDIDEFTLVKLNSGTQKPVTGENIAVNSDVLTVDAAGWYAEDAGGDQLELYASAQTESEYIRVTSGTDGIISIKNSASKKLEPGKYFVTTRARIGILDCAKYTFKDDAMTLIADENMAKLRASFEGKTLMSVEGEDSVLLTSEWADVSFILEVTEPTPVKKLKLIADGATAIDFDYINIDTKINNLDMDAYDPNSGTGLPPVVPADANNLLDGAVSADNLPYWTTDGQTLEVKEDSAGVYFSASNITDNKLGFTYKPGFTVKAGTYKFTAQMRTKNAGEKSKIRVMVGSSFGSAPIDNVWRTVSLNFTVARDTSFELKIYGGPMKININDYEFRNLRFTDVNYIPDEVNLYENGAFDITATVVGEWKMGYGTGDITVNTEDGNNYLTSANRKDANALMVLPFTYTPVPGDVYKISYDIRTSEAGETMNAYLAVGEKADNLITLAQSYKVTDEWTHVEYTYVPITSQTLCVWFGGVDDGKSFDLDNVSVVKKSDNSEAIPEGGQYYTSGDFEGDAEAILADWEVMFGSGTVEIGSEDGNSYLTVKDRAEAYIPAQLSTGLPAIVGRTYRVSYDVRTSVKGETMQGRTALVTGGITYQLLLTEGYAEGGPHLSVITDEWQHLEYTCTVETPGEILLQLRGGVRGEPDNKSFDVDNLVIEILD